jgi:hypothetical protein
MSAKLLALDRNHCWMCKPQASIALVLHQALIKRQAETQQQAELIQTMQSDMAVTMAKGSQGSAVGHQLQGMLQRDGGLSDAGVDSESALAPSARRPDERTSLALFRDSSNTPPLAAGGPSTRTPQSRTIGVTSSTRPRPESAAAEPRDRVKKRRTEVRL